jgi:molybdate transport system substrate-binding protein
MSISLLQRRCIRIADRIREDFFCLLAVVLLLSACQAASDPPSTDISGSAASPIASSVGEKAITLQVFAAASLAEPFNEMGRIFESAHPGVEVMFNFAGSQALAQQLIQGAPVDVFASANMAQVQNIVDGDRAADGTPRVFATNRLVLIVPADNPGEIQRLQDLAKSGLRLVLAAKEVPVGQYSLEFIQKADGDADFPPGFADAVLENVVSYEDNVKAVLAKVRLGEADGGIVYASDASSASAEHIGVLEIPAHLNVKAQYPIIMISESLNPLQASAWIDFVLSPQGQAILAKFGFSPAP